MKRTTCAFALLSAAFTCVVINLLLPSHLSNEESETPPIFIWWTPRFPGEPLKMAKCHGGSVCIFSNDRHLKDETNIAGFLFYGSDFDFFDLPLPRNPREHIWGLLHEESPRNTPILSHAPALKLFNYSSTVSRHSDIPLMLQYLRGMEDLLSLAYFVDTVDKNKLLSKISPILYLQSDCDTASDRDRYVEELMKYIPVDSYGTCLNNKELPAQFQKDYLNSLNADQFLQFVAKYKFTIAIENGICDDYITEKLWRPLTVGSVPIYMGSPSVTDWLPHPNSTIAIADFDSPQDLASFIHHLNSNDEEYEKFLVHKIGGQISNKRLLNSLEARTWNADGDEDSGRTFVEAFECFVCEKNYEHLRNENLQPSVVNESHYKCSRPIPSVSYLKHSHEWWMDEWDDSQKKALTLATLVIDQKRTNYTEIDFYNSMFDIV